jgi:hypothetical protein
MTELQQDPRDVYRDLKIANDALHEQHKVRLVDGPAEGTELSVPDGVNNLQVEVDGDMYTYLRGAREEYTFQVYKKK